jgi:hypothetical protein
MWKRLLIVAMLIATPTAAWAGPGTPNPSAPVQPGASDALLGPQTGARTGSSSADSAALQPAGNTPLQSTTNDADGLTAPTQTNLQAPAANSNDLQVLGGEADGGPHSLDDSTSSPIWTWTALIILLALVGGCVNQLIRDRRRFRSHHSRP